MALPQIDESAGWAAAVIFIGSVLWKVWLHFKADKRNDSAADRDHDSESHLIGGYDRLIRQLRAEVDRLAENQTVILSVLDEERAARYKAERIARELQDRVESLEGRLKDLGFSP